MIESWLAFAAKLIRAPRTIACLVRDRWWGPWMLKARGVRCGAGLIIVGIPRIRISPSTKIIIGKNVALFSTPESNPLQLFGRCHLCCWEEGAEIIVGDDVGMSGTVIVAASRITIGSGTIIGANCTILDTDFHPLSPENRRGRATKGAKTSHVLIGCDCFIGTRAIILKGTSLGDGCVVGAGSVVSGIFPDRSVIAGNPAKLIKTLS